MSKLTKEKAKDKTILIILVVVCVGLTLFNIGMGVLLRDIKDAGACKLCVELNDYLEECIYPLDEDPNPPISLGEYEP